MFIIVGVCAYVTENNFLNFLFLETISLLCSKMIMCHVGGSTCVYISNMKLMYFLSYKLSFKSSLLV